MEGGKKKVKATINIGGPAAGQLLQGGKNDMHFANSPT